MGASTITSWAAWPVQARPLAAVAGQAGTAALGGCTLVLVGAKVVLAGGMAALVVEAVLADETVLVVEAVLSGVVTAVLVVATAVVVLCPLARG